MEKFELSFKVADVLAIGFELVIEETKKLKKISNRFEAEFKLLQELKNSLELKQEIEVNSTTLPLIDRALELAFKSAKKLRKVEFKRFQTEMETLNSLRLQLGLSDMLPKKVAEKSEQTEKVEPTKSTKKSKKTVES